MSKFQTIRTKPPLSAYIGIPKGEGPFPAVLIFMHRPGVDEGMQIVVKDLVKAGYVGICWDSYRGGILKESYTDDTVFEDFEATLDYIKKKIPSVDSGRIGVMGFCMGGRHAYLAATRYSEHLKVVVSYYGFPMRGKSDDDTPFHQIGEMNIPVLGIFGKLDHLFPFSDVEQFSKNLLNHKPKFGEHSIKVYDDVGHGFLNPNSPKYGDGKSAKRAWEETIAFYKKNL